MIDQRERMQNLNDKVESMVSFSEVGNLLKRILILEEFV
jgi:flagellar biosynthesis chaperone FliJ